MKKKIDFDEISEFLDHFSYLKEIAGDVDCKMTIPSPAMLHLICCVRGSETYRAIDRYKNEDDLYHEIALAYQKAIKAFYARGCRYLQFDDTSLGVNSVIRINATIMQAVVLTLTRLLRIM